MNAKTMLAEAHDKLEQNSFSEACALYRQAAMISEPNQKQLGNLAVAEEEERLQYRRELCRRYPGSFDCKLSLIQILNSAAHSSLAVQLASELLSASDLRENQHLLLRFVRLKSAIATTNVELVIEDFAELWKAGEDNGAAYRCRKGILMSLASCSDPAYVEAFQRLSELAFLDEQVAHFFELKAEELRMMRLALDQNAAR